MSDLSNDTKKHTTKSRETIPLNMLSDTFRLYRFFELQLHGIHELKLEHVAYMRPV
jgi:hypothetical protein